MRNLFAVSLPFLDEFAIMYLLRWQVWKTQKFVAETATAAHNICPGMDNNKAGFARWF